MVLTMWLSGRISRHVSCTKFRFMEHVEDHFDFKEHTRPHFWRTTNPDTAGYEPLNAVSS